MQLLVRPIREEEVEQEITQRDQFNTDAIGLAEILVREAHQNSMDGRSKGVDTPVRTRFQIVEARSEDRDFWRSIFDPLKEHLDACEIDVTELDFGKPRLFLIEDFGTTGLL